MIRHAAAQINTTKSSEICHEITHLKLWKRQKQEALSVPCFQKTLGVFIYTFHMIFL